MSILGNVAVNLIKSASLSGKGRSGRGRSVKGTRRERFSEEEEPESLWGDPNIVAAAVLFAVWLLFVAIAAAVAVSCGAGFRDYVVVVLDPWVYLMIRLAVPCGPRG
jgi:hypothetical protein